MKKQLMCKIFQLIFEILGIIIIFLIGLILINFVTFHILKMPDFYTWEPVYRIMYVLLNIIASIINTNFTIIDFKNYVEKFNFNKIGVDIEIPIWHELHLEIGNPHLKAIKNKDFENKVKVERILVRDGYILQSEFIQHEINGKVYKIYTYKKTY